MGHVEEIEAFGKNPKRGESIGISRFGILRILKTIYWSILAFETTKSQKRSGTIGLVDDHDH